jgi:hypothetical protein
MYLYLLRKVRIFHLPSFRLKHIGRTDTTNKLQSLTLLDSSIIETTALL